MAIASSTSHFCVAIGTIENVPDLSLSAISFFVRHAYFTGGQDPYKKLKRDLKAEIDEDAWASLYRTVSPPFAKPSTGRIAVKVINDYGDEVLQVFDV